ncbi:MAG: hypothetical protein GY714_13210 [Desulfobacterales bacterium]|nr:hypothetical protein [Desulfobacterales bacterium]
MGRKSLLKISGVNNPAVTDGQLVIRFSLIIIFVGAGVAMYFGGEDEEKKPTIISCDTGNENFVNSKKKTKL